MRFYFYSFLKSGTVKVKNYNSWSGDVTSGGAVGGQNGVDCIC